MDFSEKVVLVTGSRRGIGLAIAQGFAKSGAHVIMNATSPIDEAVLADLKNLGASSVTQFAGNVADFDWVKEMMQAIKKEFGQLDVLVNNAGITRDTLLMRMSEEVFDEVIDVNLKGAFNTTRHALPMMMKKRQGAIINLTSIVGQTGNIGQANYAASKAGLIGLTKSAALEGAARGVTVNAIAPGFIETEMTGQLNEKIQEQLLEQIPLKRYGQVEDIVAATLFLAGHAYITGQTLHVNGGMVMV